ncbi:MAG: 23S rRNA (uracil(1939)-C(5))-methyltransferase RlmD [Lachnospiraceae bacterium]|nr:23S rRNA (uracil(1939)-C(5))-methyltransferase RlmD [Lachnospiraceae bacterium]
MLKKNDLIELEITAAGANGEGIGKIGGFPVFIKDSVPGDRCMIRITRVRRNLAYGHIDRILEPSVHRIRPECPVSARCGGCTLQAMDYASELDFKEKRVRDCLHRIGGIVEDVLDQASEPILGAEDPFRYRNKAQYPIGRDRNGEIVAGFYAERSHEIIPCGDCLIAPVEFPGILKAFTDYMKEAGLPPYDEASGSGLVRHLMLRKAFSSGEIMAVPVLTSEKIPHRKEMTEALMRAGVATAAANINPDTTNVILGKMNIVLFGTGFLEDRLCGLTFRLSPQSFYQVNPVQAERIYDIVLEYAGLKPEDEAWDICCGIGTISLCLAKHCRRVLGIEISEEAVRDARANAKRNGLSNTVFMAGAAEDLLPRLVAGDVSAEGFDRGLPSREDPAAGSLSQGRPSVIVLDPPRSGMEEDALNAVISIKPERVVYVSCDPATLARDLKLLLAAGYALRRYRPIDQFCRTSHVETICLLSKLSSAKHHIEINVDMDELDLTSAEAKATYEEIRNWVQEKYGLHVTNLNIAQVKQKHGIIERENYNKPKSPDSKQPGCPEEKVKAIEDAMRHFQMI